MVISNVLVNSQFDPDFIGHFKWTLIFQPRRLPGFMLIYQRIVLRIVTTTIVHHG